MSRSTKLNPICVLLFSYLHISSTVLYCICRYSFRHRNNNMSILKVFTLILTPGVICSQARLILIISALFLEDADVSNYSFLNCIRKRLYHVFIIFLNNVVYYTNMSSQPVVCLPFSVAPYFFLNVH